MPLLLNDGMGGAQVQVLDKLKVLESRPIIGKPSLLSDRRRG